MTVLAAHKWPTNGHLIADVAQLYDLSGHVVDVTFGRGTFWTIHQPRLLITSDLDPETLADYHYDFRSLPWADGSCPVVVFDPPYKLNGTPALSDFDKRYGIDQPASWQERIQLIHDGVVECARVASDLLLVKCQDQVVSGKVRWQTLMVTGELWARGWELIDRFDMLGGYRPQPRDRRQVHAHGRPSTLLVFGPRS